MKKIILFSLLLAAVIWSGCKINYSFTGASIPPGAKTISVNYFPNYAPIVYPSLSGELTEALKDRFVSQTSLQLINDKGDLHFEGEITGFSARPLAIKNDQAALNRLTVSIKVRYTNYLDPEKDFEQTFSRYEDYDASKSIDDVQSELSALIVEYLTEDIFNKAVVDW